jgi:hypothetical protein
MPQTSADWTAQKGREDILNHLIFYIDCPKYFFQNKLKSFEKYEQNEFNEITEK